MTEDQVIRKAIRIVEGRLQKTEGFVHAPFEAHQLAILKLADRKAEVFAVLFLNTRHQLIEFREMFHGTIDSATVYPREVARAALELNAAAVIVVHNHPSGIPEPSEADRSITMKLARALDLLDVRLLDHVIVGGIHSTSMAERGLI
ncbi:MAG: DNA repair protein RadC [Gammaproteobacteria bacterium]